MQFSKVFRQKKRQRSRTISHTDTATISLQFYYERKAVVVKINQIKLTGDVYMGILTTYNIKYKQIKVNKKRVVFHYS